MRNHLTDKASDAGRFQQRLREILDRVAREELPRMDAGDMIGRQVVASLAPQAENSPAAAAVLFEAQCERTSLYLASSGATPLDAAESLVDASATLDHFNAGESERVRLIDPASRCLEDLVEIGSRSTAWTVVRVLLTSLMCSEQGKAIRELAVTRLAEALEASLEDERHFDAFGFASLVADWAERNEVSSAKNLSALLPRLLDKELSEIETSAAVAGWRLIADRAEARPVFARLVARLIGEEARDLAARQLYRSFLKECPDEAAELEAEFADLAHVHPDPGLAYDADLDALNSLLCESFGEERAWPWQNRALLARRKEDLTGALSSLARVMMMSGEPPELMGLLAPVVHQLGFGATARQFARYAPSAERRRFRLRVLDQLDAEAGTEIGGERLIAHLEANLDDSEMPLEFRPAVRKRLAELRMRRGEWQAAEEAYRELHLHEPTVALHAVRMAEAVFRGGRLSEARDLLDGEFGPRVSPHVHLLESHFSEVEDDLEAALASVQAARNCLDDAQAAGREDTQRAWLQIEARVRKDVGDEVADGALLAMLQSELHGSRHKDLDELTPILDRRLVELALLRGDMEAAREAIASFEKTNPGDHRLHLEGLRAALLRDAHDDVAFFLERMDETGGGDEPSECALARAILALEAGEMTRAVAALGAAKSADADPKIRFALAAIRAERGAEAEALTIIESEELTCPPEQALFYGALLERARRAPEALEVYRVAATHNEDVARRFGMLAVALGAQDDDRNLIAEGLGMLAPFRDADAVEVQGRGRALLAGDAVAAAETLASFGKRLGAIGAQRLGVLEAHARLRSGDLPGLLALSERLTLPDELGDWIRRRRCLEELAATGPDESGALVEIGRTLEADAEDPVMAVAADLVARICDPIATPLDLSEAPSDALVLACALGLADRERNDSDNLDARVEAIELQGGPYAELAQALRRIRSDSADAAEDAVASWADLATCFRARPPFAAADLLRGPAVEALRAGRSRDLERLITAGADPNGNLAPLRAVFVAIERGDGTGLLQGLNDIFESDPDPRWEDAQVALKAHVTAIRERPSPVWASARLRTAGKRSRVFVSGVLDYWRSVEESGTPTQQARALHHIALLELARAHEEESAGREAPEPWLKAHAAWSALIDQDEFWTTLGRRHDPAVCEQVRRRLARRLLDAHLRRAEFFVEARKNGHALRHARLAVQSPLVNDELRPWMRERLYRVLAPDVGRMLSRRDHVKALELLDRVLLADPEHGQARRELIDIAADSATRAFKVIDAFTRRPDPSTVLELATGMREYLVVVENHVLDVARKGRPQDPTLGESLAVALRGIAFLRFHRDQDVPGAGEAVELALEMIPEEHGLARKIRTFRSEVGMKRVAERLESGLSAEDPLKDSLDEVEALLEAEPASAELRRQKVKILIALGRDEVAEELAREVFAQAQKDANPDAVREAIELLDSVQSGREALRHTAKLESLDRLLADGNWRTAEQLHREIAIGKEDDVELVVRQVEILLGLRKVRLARERLQRLGGYSEVADRRRRLDARLSCLEHMAVRGGDLYAAYELYERGEFKRCQALLQRLPDVDTRELGARFLNAICQTHLEGAERAAKIVEQARKRGTEEDAMWVLELLEMELPK